MRMRSAVFLFIFLFINSCGAGVDSNGSSNGNAPDSPGIEVSAQSLNVSEGDTHTAVLVNATAAPAPGQLIVIDISSDDETEGTVSPAQIIFDETDWQVQKSFDITPVDDVIYDGTQTFHVTLDTSASTDVDYASLEIISIAVSNLDNDIEPVPGIEVSTQALNMSEGDTQTVVLVNATAAPAPGQLIVIDISSDDETEGTVSPAQIIFDETDWQDQKSFDITPADDAIYDGTKSYHVTLDPSASSDPDYASLGAITITIQNEDDEPGFAAQGSKADPIDITGQAPYEGMVDDTDSYYSISVTQGAAVKVAVSGYTEDLRLHVYDGDETFTSLPCMRYSVPEFYMYCPMVPETSSLYIKVTNVYPGLTGTNFTISVEPLNAAKYYIETMPNTSGNSAYTFVSVIDIYGNLLAQYDTGSYIQGRFVMESGSTYYFLVSDNNSEGGYYSFRIGDSSFVGNSTGTAGEPDSYEPDIPIDNATDVEVNIIQDHSLSPAGDADWFVFTAP